MPPTSETRPQFSIATIFLATTLIAIAMAAAWYVPCLWFALLFIAPPAGVRAAIVGYHSRRAGTTLSVGNKVELVVESVYASIIAFAMALAAGITVWFVLTLIHFPSVLAVVLCLPSSLAVFIFSLWCSTRPLDQAV